jgi:hypothetical protein
VAALYLDNNVTVRAAPLLNASGHTVHTTARHNRRAADDHEQLLFAAENGWVFISHNWRDFRMLHGAWQLWSRAWGVAPEHGGILVIEPSTEQKIAAVVNEFLAGHAANDVGNALWRHKTTTGWVRQS